MTMTDPIADMLTRIRNANSAMFDTVRMPGSKLKESLAAILEREGYIAGYKVEPNAGQARHDPRDHHEVLAATAPGPSPASSASPSPACASTPGPTGCRACSAAWAWPWSRPARA